MVPVLTADRWMSDALAAVSQLLCCVFEMTSVSTALPAGPHDEQN